MCCAIGSANGIARVALYGEVYGAGVQDLHYGETRKDTPGFAVFDIAIDEGSGRSWLSQGQLREVCVDFNLTLAPVLYEGKYDYDTLTALAEGNTSLGGATNLREGLVVRAVPERVSDAVVVELSPSSSVTAISPELAAQSFNSSTDGFENNVDARP
jgi:RNA ligase (TIGR02306 family)